jgi:hypothetical protein
MALMKNALICAICLGFTFGLLVLNLKAEQPNTATETPLSSTQRCNRLMTVMGGIIAAQLARIGDHVS